MKTRSLTSSDQVGYVPQGKWKLLVQRVILEGPLVIEDAPRSMQANFRQAALAQGMKAKIRTLTNGTGYVVSVEPLTSDLSQGYSQQETGYPEVNSGRRLNEQAK